MTQKILAAHAGLPEVKAGDLIEAKLDLVLGNDITTPVADRPPLIEAGFTRVFDREKIAIVLDHSTPCKDIKSAAAVPPGRGSLPSALPSPISSTSGQVGIEHALLPEQGIGRPRRADHRRGLPHLHLRRAGRVLHRRRLHRYGSRAWLSGENWFKVSRAPSRSMLTGKLRPYVSGKDVILHLIGMIGVDGALYKSHGVHRPRRRQPVDGRPLHHRQYGH